MLERPAGSCAGTRSRPRPIPSLSRIVGSAAGMPADGGIYAIEHPTAYDSKPALREIEVPIHAINADEYPTNLEAARRSAPQFDAVIVERVGH
jgi:hypothetical protein